jgi:hypothetical protein
MARFPRKNKRRINLLVNGMGDDVQFQIGLLENFGMFCYEF